MTPDEATRPIALQGRDQRLRHPAGPGNTHRDALGGLLIRGFWVRVPAPEPANQACELGFPQREDHKLHHPARLPGAYEPQITR